MNWSDLLRSYIRGTNRHHQSPSPYFLVKLLKQAFFSVEEDRIDAVRKLNYPNFVTHKRQNQKPFLEKWHEAAESEVCAPSGPLLSGQLAA